MEFEFWDRKWTKRGNPGVGELVPKEQGSAPARAPLTGSSGEPRPSRAPVSTEPGPHSAAHSTPLRHSAQRGSVCHLWELNLLLLGW